MGESSSEAIPSSDAELIAAVASGDAAAYVTLQVRHTPAARLLAGQLVASPDEAEEVLAETFTRLRDVLRRGDGPVESLRPYLLTAVRRVALERRGDDPPESAGGQAEIPNLGEPLFTDPATAELENAPLARAYASLPERQRAAAWHTMIERTDPAEAAAILGLTEAGVAELPVPLRTALSQAYLELYLSSLTREDCKAEAGQLGPHLGGTTRGADERTVQRHLRGCRECRAVAIELTGLDRSLRHTLAPIFLGATAEAYLSALSAVGANAAPRGQAIGVPGWMREVPRRMREVPRRMRQATRQQRAIAGGVLLLAAFAIAGLSLTLAASTAPPHRANRPFAVAIAPPSPVATVPPSSSVPAPTRPAPTKPAPTAPAVSPARPARPAPARSSPPARTSPAPTSPAPTSPAPTPTPAPSPTVLPRHHHRHSPPA
jgi:DNA-directed RNA polymerase specialized sigma24 family protein